MLKFVANFFCTFPLLSLRFSCFYSLFLSLSLSFSLSVVSPSFTFTPFRFVFLFSTTIFFPCNLGYIQGVEWQKSYLIACLVQMMLEIYLFETIECLWINVFVPSLVSTEVQRVNNLLLSIINDLCTKASLGQKLVDSSQPGAYSLDVPSFLYTSTRVANAHPTLMESMIIRSYHTHLPGELARKWSKSYNQEHSGKTYKGGLCGEKVGHMRHTNSVSWPIAAIGSLLLTLQFAAMTPFEFQKMIIRFIQPFLYGGLVLLGQDIIKSPIYIVITAVILFTIAGYLLYQYYKYEINNENDNRNMAKIAPIPIAEEDHEKSSFGSKGSGGGIMAGSHDDAALKKEKEDRFRRKEAKAKLHQKVRRSLYVCYSWFLCLTCLPSCASSVSLFLSFSLCLPPSLFVVLFFS
jgi:hypothetical protein